MTVFERAICFAVKAHEGQMRKRVVMPYIIHPLEVATICATLSSDQEVLAAAVLHDTVEDTDTTIEEIAENFGPRVAALVAAETENKRSEIPPAESWRLRKLESLEVLKNAEDPGVRILWLGDKLANVRSFYRNWLVWGDAIWQDFHQKDPDQQAWYYRSILELLGELRDTDAWKELRDTVQALFGLEQRKAADPVGLFADSPLKAQDETAIMQTDGPDAGHPNEEEEDEA